MSDEHLGLINVSKHQIDLLNEDFSLVHFSSYQTGVTARILPAGEINRILAECVIEQEATKWAAPIVLTLIKDG